MSIEIPSALNVALQTAKTLSQIVNTTVYKLLDEIGDTHTNAAKLAISRGDIQSAIANLYPAITAYERSMNKSEIVRFLTSWIEDTKLVPAAKLIGVCCLMATCWASKGKMSELAFYQAKALKAFEVYESCIWDGYTASHNLSMGKGTTHPSDPSGTLQYKKQEIEETFRLLRARVSN